MADLTGREVAERLWTQPIALADVTRPQGAGGIPTEAGIYAWWAKADAMANVPSVAHPTCAGFSLLYVGISPKRVSSSGTLRSRVVGHHIGGNTGSSTFRLVLASLLLDDLKLACRVTPAKKYLLERADNHRLRDWQFKKLSLTWVERPRPWEVEDEVIELMQPPLNCEGNASHPFYATVKASRGRFRQSARPSSGERG